MISQIVCDLREVPIIVTSRRGWGKSTTVKHLVKWMKDQQSKQIIIKVFDPSLIWLSSPVEYRQKVTRRKILRGEVDNIGDCVYLLDLPQEDRRAFIATIIRQDMDERKRLVFKYGLDTVKGLPLILYILEESNQILNSTSLNKQDKAGEVLSDWVSIGRNWNLTGILLTTAVSGELSTKIRRRSEWLLGRLNSSEDIRLIKNLKNWEHSETTKLLDKHQFIYGDDRETIIELGEVLDFKKPKLYRRKWTNTDTPPVEALTEIDQVLQSKPKRGGLVELVGILAFFYILSLIF